MALVEGRLTALTGQVDLLEPAAPLLRANAYSLIRGSAPRWRPPQTTGGAFSGPAWTVCRRPPALIAYAAVFLATSAYLLGRDVA